MRYTGDLGCKYRGVPHDLRIVYQNDNVKVEVCSICNRKFRWNKRHKGRVNNVEYLKAHVRNFAQRSGATKRVYHRIYKPETLTIKI